MFSFFKKKLPVGEFLAVEGRLLTFRTDQEFASGELVKIELEVAGDGVRLKLPILPASCRPHPDGGYVCVAEVPTDDRALEQLRAVLGADGEGRAVTEQGAAIVRKHRRYKIGIRILSPALPGFQAISVDFSREGLQLKAEGEVEKGTLMTLTLEVDDPMLPRVLCQAEVLWTRPITRTTTAIGLRFVQLSDEIRHQLLRFEELIQKRKEVDL